MYYNDISIKNTLYEEENSSAPARAVAFCSAKQGGIGYYMKNKKPAFRRILPLFLAMVLCITMQDMTAFAAETAETALKSETIEITGAERYDEEYYAKPALRFPVKQKRLYSQEREEQSLEEYVVAALENYETVIDVSAYNISRSEGSQEYLRILNNNPQLFYVQAQAVLSCMGNQVIYYRPYYLAGKEEAMQMKEELEMAVQQALEQVDESMDAVQKALVVHDYLVQNCEYDQERLMTGSVPDISHTSYGALVNGMAVCDGYAHAYAYIMEHKLGIPCTVVSSDSMNHAWNMIEIDGKWYHVDLTWDDPVWDCIGRVNHNYFLLSDEAISQNHYVWTNDYTANSDRYDREFWIGVESAISYYNGAWYYSGYEPGNRKVVLKKKKGLFAANAETVYQTSLWQASGQSFYPSSFMYLAQANRKLYFNTSTEIMQMNAGGDVQVFYEPDDLVGKQIFGFTVQGGEFLYAPNDDAYTSGKQSDIRKYSRGKIEGITAENVTGVYNGNPYKIEIQGLKEGDLVYYALAGGADIKYSETQPDMTNAGTYRVRYRVDREGYAAHGGIVTVTITKAETEYTIPQECTGKSGGTLADIELPEGFAWKNPQTQLYEEGKNAFPAVYTPEDSVNYQTVDLDIIVSVTCPGQ